MITKQGNTGSIEQTSTAAPASNISSTERGLFDFAGAPQASKDAAAIESVEEQTNITEDQSVTSNTEDSLQTNEEQSSEETTDTANSAEKEPPVTESKVEKPIEINGRVFKNVDELSTAYKNSSAEGIRLAHEVELHKSKINELNKIILDYEAQQIDAPFPALLSTDPEQEAELLATLPYAKQTEYILAKNEWIKQAQAKKQAFEQKKQALAQEEAMNKRAMELTALDMQSNTVEYPFYNELKPIMDKVIKTTPVIDGRPETPYLAYWIAYGLQAHSQAKMQQLNKNKEKVAHAETIKTASTQITGGKGKVNPPATTMASSLVDAYKKRTGGSLF